MCLSLLMVQEVLMLELNQGCELSGLPSQLVCSSILNHLPHCPQSLWGHLCQYPAGSMLETKGITCPVSMRGENVKKWLGFHIQPFSQSSYCVGLPLLFKILLSLSAAPALLQASELVHIPKTQALWWLILCFKFKLLCLREL